MDELKEIWHRNTAWENICWILRVILLLILLPYAIVKEFYFKDKE